MVCEHLQSLEQAIIDAGIQEISRGQAWSQQCREWVYFDCLLDLAALRRRFSLADCVTDHSHLGTHDGHEAGFYCSEHKDGVMGVHPAYHQAGDPMFS